MISIISAYYGNEEMTVQFLDNLERTCKGMDVEMILVNSESKDIKHPFIDKYIYNPKNQSFSHSMNLGLKVATGEYLIIIGNDGFPMHEGWIEQLTTVLEDLPNVMIVAPVWDKPNFSVYKHLVLSETDNGAFMKMIPAVCWCMRKVDFDKIGYFDEQYIGGCYEDNDYCMRVLSIGGEIYVNKKCKIIHFLSQTIGKMNVNKFMNDNNERFRKKWGL
ncbi:MAG TPA: glycosyltransferase [Allocoleopsis sp.]